MYTSLSAVAGTGDGKSSGGGFVIVLVDSGGGCRIHDAVVGAAAVVVRRGVLQARSGLESFAVKCDKTFTIRFRKHGNFCKDPEPGIE